MCEGNNIFRMNFVIQDNAATTLETNLVKIIEAVLYDSEKGKMTSLEIADTIKINFKLDFSDGEIKKAISKKGNHIDRLDGDFYALKPEHKAALVKRTSFDAQLKKFIRLAINELKFDIEETELEKILKDYLYYCFNSNKSVILSLLEGGENKSNKYTSDERKIRIINTFLQWENPEKNEFIYKIVSYGYIYCSLTIKKDKILSNKLFRGKRFILDANIIFRLAGINNDSRQNTIKSFAEKCRYVGVELCYTSVTLDEIQRVIFNKVQWIESVTGNQEPLNVEEFDSSENDFYSLYFKWSNESGNNYDDYSAFKNYLTDIVFDVLNKLKMLTISNFKIQDSNKFDYYVESLGEYKNNRRKKRQSKASLETDISNYLYIGGLRGKNKNGNLWNTNEYFISADQNLIAWATNHENGIQTIVLPSVWLTIMLRFSGRTEDDYKAFCSFLELRTHDSDEKIDVFQLLKKLSEKTSDIELKERIVREVYEHKNEYEQPDNENYDIVVEKAFDKVVGEKDERIDQLQKTTIKKENQLEDLKAQKEIDDKFKIIRLVDADTRRHFRILKFLNKIMYPVAFLLFVVLVILSWYMLQRKGWLFLIAKSVMPEAVNGMGNILGSISIIFTLVSIVAGFIVILLRYLYSEKRQNRYKGKREEYYWKLFGNKEK